MSLVSIFHFYSNLSAVACVSFPKSLTTESDSLARSPMSSCILIRCNNAYMYCSGQID